MKKAIAALSLMIAAACGVSSSAQKGRTVNKNIFELRLEATSGPGLTAVLHNGTATAHKVLISPNLQPCDLEIVDAAGKRLDRFDERTRMKYDRSVRKSMYKEIASNGSQPLESGEFQKQANVYTLQWGPYTFEEVPPGSYSVRAHFDSAIDYVSQEGKQVPAPGPIWKGKLTSNSVTVRLP